MRQVKNLAALGELVATVVMDNRQKQAFCHHMVTAPSQSFFSQTTVLVSATLFRVPQLLPETIKVLLSCTKITV